MSLILFYDTETTGLPLFKEPSEHHDQPHIVQLAAALVDSDTRKTVSSIDVIIKPDGWTIPEDMTAIHGISNDLANDVGVPLDDAIYVFLSMWNDRVRVAHNQSFDARIIRIAQHQIGDFSDYSLELWKNGIADCTQKMATPVLKLPPTDKMVKVGLNKYKPANLMESYRHFFGFDFENAHSAMADVNACIAVYFAIKDLEQAQ
jgi:DNA polymerase III subunit epsilon